MRPAIPTRCRLLKSLAFCLALPAALEAADVTPAGRPAALRPVTSQMTDVTDDPESAVSGAPRLDWGYFGHRTRLLNKYTPEMPAHRRILGIDPGFNLIQVKKLAYPLDHWSALPLDDDPAFPALLFASIGKLYDRQGERPRVHDTRAVPEIIKHYPHVLFGGGQVAEIDTIVSWLWKRYFPTPPTGPYGDIFPSAWLDHVENRLWTGGAPYLYFQANRAYSLHVNAKARIMSLASSQLMQRADQVLVPNLVTLRSAARQNPFPYGVQFSGQPWVRIQNEREVVERGAEPVFEYPTTEREGLLYHKSYALNRQVLYLSWLNGARFFMYETGLFARMKKHKIPDPLGRFMAGVDKLIQRVGPTGPVQTPIALLSEFSHGWRPPLVDWAPKLKFTTLDDCPYTPGDYQRHGIREFFMRNYLQCERIYQKSMSETHALADTPYGESVDLLLSDVRDEALARYGLVIWSGVAPRVPSLVRDKLIRYTKTHKGRVVLFGEAAKSLFGEWFSAAGSQTVPAGAQVVYRGERFTEEAAFRLKTLQDGGKGIPQMKVLATVNGIPLIVESQGHLVLVLSDFGINSEPAFDPAKTEWQREQPVTQIPHTLLLHARRLLHDETLAQIPFTVGNNKLHYVVTRPRKGEYLLGLVNDYMQGEPFEIRSRIGPVTKMEAVELGDNLDVLKKAANGIPYAPPNYRLEPKKLPLDYGPSDDSHIEGKGFRLFRIRVTEQGVREVPKIAYPSRPAGRVLALAHVGHVRRTLQGLSMFYSWFDGIQVDAASLLETDDPWLKEQGYYLDRRGVRIVVDGTAATEKELSAAIQKLGALGKAPKDLIASVSSSRLTAHAEAGGVRLVKPAHVNRLSAPGHRFRSDAALNIVELFHANEEALYQDLTRFETGKGTGALRGIREAMDLCPAPKAEGKQFCYVGPHFHRLGSLLIKHRDAFGKYKGVRLDSKYLRNKTETGLAADGAALRKLGLRVVVDLRRDQSFSAGISFRKHVPHFDRGVRLFNEVLGKMRHLASSDLIMAFSDDSKEAEQNKERDEVMASFVQAARANKINLHLICKPGMQLSDASYLDTPNVFIIEGLKGKRASPYASLD